MVKIQHQITIVELEGLSYVAWLQSALLYIKSGGKMGYLNGRIQELELDDLADD